MSDQGNPTAPTSARSRILARVRTAAASRSLIAHPGVAPTEPGFEDVVTEFSRRLTGAGGEVVMLNDETAAATWLAGLSASFGSAAVSPWLSPLLRPHLPEVGPEEADLGVSLARAAAAESGTILLDSTEGRRLQLLPPVHLVWLPRSVISRTLGAAFMVARVTDGAAIGLHSGPSKSADIGGVLVRGVHGPGRLIVAILGD